jgi:hypothetical protein
VGLDVIDLEVSPVKRLGAQIALLLFLTVPEQAPLLIAEYASLVLSLE